MAPFALGSTLRAWRLHAMNGMSAFRSTAWSVIIALALIFIAMVGYGSCYNRP